jgi:hypothetical protein
MTNSRRFQATQIKDKINNYWFAEEDAEERLFFV